jgi:uncharacterized protein YndB with AHSA1/START domain
MEKTNFSIVINAPKEKVWKTLINKDTYEQWAAVFMPGSSYVGDWSEGSKILFIAPDETGKLSGMVSRIKENRQDHYISIETVGVVSNDEEDIRSPEAKNWAGSLENYTFKDLNGKTELRVDLTFEGEINPEMLEMFEKTWPKALNKLKELAEK